MKIKFLFLSAFLAFVLGAFSGCAEEKVVNDFEFKEFEEGEQITLQSVMDKQLVLVRQNGGFVILNDEKKVLMVDIFGTFCAPCKEEAPHLTQLWRKNADKFTLIGLTHFESVSDDEVRNFANNYGAFYFISNQKQNERLVKQILKDINYQNMEQLPFKVVLKNGVYQSVQDFWSKGKKVKFYLGKVPTSLMEEDLRGILDDKAN